MRIRERQPVAQLVGFVPLCLWLVYLVHTSRGPVSGAGDITDWLELQGSGQPDSSISEGKRALAVHRI